MAPRGRPGPAGPRREGEIAFGTIDSWLIYRLTGGRVHATDPTNASRTSSSTSTSAAGTPSSRRSSACPRRCCPHVRPSSGVFGETVALDGLPAGIPIAGDAGDQQAALSARAARARHGEEHLRDRAFLVLNTGTGR